MVELRRAVPGDSAGIGSIVQEVWGEQVLADACQAHIENAACSLWVAADGNEIAGFVSAFLSVGRSGQRRWEVDLLAVRGASRGQGLGRELLERACQDAQAHGLTLARAVVRVDNTAGRRTFERAGFTESEQVHELLTWPPGHGSSAINGGSVTFVPVSTLTYRGLWLEGLTAEAVAAEEQRSAVRMARAIIAQQGRANTGALIPAGEAHRLPAELRAEAAAQGAYLWYTRTFWRSEGGPYE